MTTSSAHSGNLPFTFGIEIEVCFGIDEDQVNANPAFQHLQDLQWIEQDGDEVWDEPGVETQPGPLTEYYDVAMLMKAATVLRRKGADMIVKKQPKPEDPDNIDYSRWTLTGEGAVRRPEADAEFADWTNDRYTTMEGWVFVGIELVSRILEVPDLSNLPGPALDEVAQFLGCMRGPQDGPCVFMANAENASVHVHVGLPPTPEGDPVDIPLDVLRHFAWICLTFEDVITLLHHPERHNYPNTKIVMNAESNRNFLGRQRAGSFLHTCEDGPPWIPEDEFLKIFDFQSSDEAWNRIRLHTLLCTGRGHSGSVKEMFVSFQNIDHSQRIPLGAKKTVEFRQHHGTLDEDDIKHWVIFVTMLFRAAERKAREVPPAQTPLPTTFMWKVRERFPDDDSGRSLTLEEGRKYDGIFWDTERSMKELFDLLEMPIEMRRYWWRRAQEFRALMHPKYHTVGTCEEQCTKRPRRDCVGFEAGEVIPRPW